MKLFGINLSGSDYELKVRMRSFCLNGEDWYAVAISPFTLTLSELDAIMEVNCDGSKASDDITAAAMVLPTRTLGQFVAFSSPLNPVRNFDSYGDSRLTRFYYGDSPDGADYFCGYFVPYMDDLTEIACRPKYYTWTEDAQRWHNLTTYKKRGLDPCFMEENGDYYKSGLAINFDNQVTDDFTVERTGTLRTARSINTRLSFSALGSVRKASSISWNDIHWLDFACEFDHDKACGKILASAASGEVANKIAYDRKLDKRNVLFIRNEEVPPGLPSSYLAQDAGHGRTLAEMPWRNSGTPCGLIPSGMAMRPDYDKITRVYFYDDLIVADNGTGKRVPIAGAIAKECISRGLNVENDVRDYVSVLPDEAMSSLVYSPKSAGLGMMSGIGPGCPLGTRLILPEAGYQFVCDIRRTRDIAEAIYAAVTN